MCDLETSRMGAHIYIYIYIYIYDISHLRVNLYSTTRQYNLRFEGLKACWNKSQQWRRAAVEPWLFRHSVNRCATLCPVSLQIKLFEKYSNHVCAVTLLNNVQMAPLYCIAVN